MELVPERCTIEHAVLIIGLPKRTVQDMAARGELPGAAKFRRRWTFDINKLRKFVAEEERKTRRRGSALIARPRAATNPSYSGSGLRARNSTGSLRHMIQQWQRNARIRTDGQ